MLPLLRCAIVCLAVWLGKRPCSHKAVSLRDNPGVSGWLDTWDRKTIILGSAGTRMSRMNHPLLRLGQPRIQMRNWEHAMLQMDTSNHAIPLIISCTSMHVPRLSAHQSRDVFNDPSVCIIDLDHQAAGIENRV